MKLLSRTAALKKLRELKDDLSAHVTERYEVRAKSCATCETKGACCQDAHFVNVDISRLEAAAISKIVKSLTAPKQDAIYARVENAIEKYSLTAMGDTFSRGYACPLFEPEAGCLVHGKAKPLACIVHACYEKSEDLPPDSLLTEREARVEDLNIKTYGRSHSWLPIPLAIRRQP